VIRHEPNFCTIYPSFHRVAVPSIHSLSLDKDLMIYLYFIGLLRDSRLTSHRQT
jgi:hypothetical protein